MQSTSEQIPKPGSDQAIEQGCTCPVIDNGHGRGYLGDGEKYGWVQRMDCPLHSPHERLRARLRAAAESDTKE